MKPSIYQVEVSAAGKLYVMPKPSGEWLEDDIAELGRMGITHLISLLENTEADELGLSEEHMECDGAGIDFTNFPIEDRALPVNSDAFCELAASLAKDIRQGGAVAIHCRAGIGRTGMLASCVLQCTGASASEAVALVSRARGVPVPDTPEQLEFIEAFRP